MADRQRAQSRLEEVRTLLLPLLLEQAKLEAELKIHERYLAKLPSMISTPDKANYGDLTRDILTFVSDAGGAGVRTKDVNGKFGKSARATVKRLCDEGVLRRTSDDMLLRAKT